MDIEKMDIFFNKRADKYDSHMKQNVSNFNQFYNSIANQIKDNDQIINILDIGCGTGIELKSIFDQVPRASFHCIDLSKEMLNKLKTKYQNKSQKITTELGSYLEIDFKDSFYDYALSVMSLHHLVYLDKLKLYKKIYKALKVNSIYIEGDYIVDQKKERLLLNQYNKLEQEIRSKPGSYHIDIPFSLKTQRKVIKEAGFKDFKVLYNKKEAVVFSCLK
ncbi:MAG: class I SAM-dependent methyltransferase [Halanaerobiales bacterium]|nr:class I SAM-dependent methyltransferase [Halanaerobiales bacterium]